MKYLGKVFLPFVVILSNVWSAAPSTDNHFGAGLLSRILVHSAVVQKPSGLSKKTALQWKQTGSVNYYNTADSGMDTTWEFSSRDTILYDANGNEIIKKTSGAKSGWDNLESIDSTIYQNGKIAEQVSIYYSGNGSVIDGGSRYTYSYLDNGKTLLEIDYRWVDSLSKWSPVYKDSLVFSTPVNIDPVYFINDLSGMQKEFTYSYEGTSWNSTGYISKIDSESNSKTLVMLTKNSTSNDSMDDHKSIYVFNSTVWQEDNLVEIRSQVKNPINGKFYDNTKTDYSANSILYYQYDLDSASNAPYLTSKSFSFYDSHKNDTLDINCDLNSDNQSWDTSSLYRYNRLYDNNGNNNITIESDYQSYDDSWTYSKDVNSFTQINVTGIHFEKTISRQNLSILQTAGSIRICAPGITGFEVYNIQGRMIASVKQNAASSLTVNLSDPNARISSGSYIAKLICKNDVRSVPLIIKR